MIYKESILKNEIRKPYIDSLSDKRKALLTCAFLFLVTVGFTALLYFLGGRVHANFLPEIPQPTGFTILFAYNLIAYVFYSVFLVIKCDSVTLKEIRENKWYLLSQMGYDSTALIVWKMLASVLTVFGVYCLGYALTAAFVGLLHYANLGFYVLPFFISGAISALLVVGAAIVLTLYSTSKVNARLYLIGFILINEISKLFLGYYGLISNTYLMRSALNLFTPYRSFYGLISVASLLVLSALAFIGARRKTEFYALKNEVGGIAAVRYNDNRILSVEPEKKNISLPVKIFRILLMIILLVSIVLNSVIMIVSLGNTKEISFFGYIPYIFKSTTMTPAIAKDDLVVFSKIDGQYALSPGDIVLFKDDAESISISVMKVTEVRDDHVTVDILKYPVINEPGTLKKTVEREKIYGLLYSESHVIGLIVTFLNSLVGRILTILVPAAFIFFTKDVLELLKRLIS